jgi:Mg-chelatase subunit ChlD
MGFQHPELLLLSIPAALVWWFTRSRVLGTSIVRALALVCLVLAIAGPYLRTAQRGRDLVVVADRSRSMSKEGAEAALEIVRLAEEARRDGDRVAVVSFGARSGIEELPTASGRFARFERDVDADGSDIARALETALDLVPADREGSILLVTDGEANGPDPLTAARRAFARGVHVDVRAFTHPDVADLSIERIDLPENAAVLEPFQFSVWVRSDRRVEADFALERRGKVLSSGRRVFEAGLNRIVLRDVLDEAGVADYRVKVDAGADRVPENNAAVAALRVDGPRSILVLDDDGAEDTLVRALRAARIPVKVARPEGTRLDALALTAYRAVVLENVAASRLGTNAKSLAAFVTDFGGGLFVTGGKASFGTGGYFRSVIDPLLPVSMEMRQEHRKQAVALSIAMDRSGSMSVGVGNGMTKMDLADLGAVAAIELLSPMDSVSVIAVDTTGHVIQSQTQVSDISGLTSRVRTIQSEGGGIYIYEALTSAARELRDAEQTTRHVILFADAADSEEEGAYVQLLADFEKSGVTVSVIALGTEADSDAKLLKDIAERGKGQIYFTVDPSELPRLFAQDTLTVSRATFIEDATACEVTPNLFGLGEVPGNEFAELGGYNLTYTRSGAVAGVVTKDEYQAPVFAFMQQGLGRTAAFTGQIGGTYGASVVAWPGFASFFVSIARWLVGQEEPSDVFASVRRDGKEAIVSVEIEHGSSAAIDASSMKVRWRDEGGVATEVALTRVSENRYEARAPLAREGILLGTLALDGKDGSGKSTVQLAPIALPYSPEFERGSDPHRGERLARAIAQESGGLVDPNAAEFFRGQRTSKGWNLLTRELALAALMLVLLEIAARRLELWSFVRVPAFVRTAFARQRARSAARPITATAIPRAAASPSVAPEPQVETPKAAPTMESALDKARRAADKRLDR